MLRSIGMAPFACTVLPANARNSRLYASTLQVFVIPEVQDRPTFISADAAYDAREIHHYHRKRGIKGNIPVNRRSRRHPKQGRSVLFDLELYKKHSVIERFFSGIEAFKKIAP